MTSLLVRALAAVVLVGCGGHTDTLFTGDAPDATATGGDGGGGTGGKDGGGPLPDGGSGLTDGAATSDGSAPSACFLPDGGVRPAAKGCTNTGSCAVTLHGGCCGPQYADGINHAFVTEFTACETAVQMACGARGCATGPVFAEDGNTGDPSKLGVSCDKGTCRTFFN